MHGSTSVHYSGKNQQSWLKKNYKKKKKKEEEENTENADACSFVSKPHLNKP